MRAVRLPRGAPPRRVAAPPARRQPLRPRSPLRVRPRAGSPGGTPGKGSAALPPALLADAPGTTLMFSFGANISASQLRRRGVSPSASAVARLPNHELVFAHRGGYATVDPRPDGDGHEVFGVVHRVSLSELALVRRWEVGYRQRRVDAFVRSNESDAFDVPVAAVAFVSRPTARLRAEVPPFREYAEKILDGAEAVGLPEAYVRDVLAPKTARAVDKRRRGREYFDLAGSGGVGAWFGAAFRRDG